MRTVRTSGDKWVRALKRVKKARWKEKTKGRKSNVKKEKILKRMNHSLHKSLKMVNRRKSLQKEWSRLKRRVGLYCANGKIFPDANWLRICYRLFKSWRKWMTLLSQRNSPMTYRYPSPVATLSNKRVRRVRSSLISRRAGGARKEMQKKRNKLAKNKSQMLLYWNGCKVFLKLKLSSILMTSNSY